MKWWWQRTGREPTQDQAAAEKKLERIVQEKDAVTRAADRMDEVPNDEFLRRIIIAFGRPQR